VTDDALRQSIRNERRRRQWSQDALAMQAGWTSQSMIAHYESGRQPLTLHGLRRIAAAFGMDLVVEFRERS